MDWSKHFMSGLISSAQMCVRERHKQPSIAGDGAQRSSHFYDETEEQREQELEIELTL